LKCARAQYLKIFTSFLFLKQRTVGFLDKKKYQ
jgi:hypothetical protein